MTTVSQSITTQSSTSIVGNFATVAASNLHSKNARKFFQDKIHNQLYIFIDIYILLNINSHLKLFS